MVTLENIVVLDEEQLHRYQQEILSIAKDLIRVCKDNDIKYSLSGGSVIGAVRHNGLIPWDDDIDINIPRESYKKLVRVFEKELGDKYYLQTPLTFPNLGIMVTQLRKKGTVARRKYDWNTNPCGISIDIYIVDNVFDNKLLRFVQQELSMLLSFVVSSIRTYNNRQIPKEISNLESKPLRMGILKKTVGRLFGVIPLKYWMSLADSVNGMCNNISSKYVTIPTGRQHFNNEIQKREDILNYIQVPFEDIKVNIPQNYDAYLKKLYGGSYMTVPPKEDRESHVFLELKYKE